MKYTIAIWIIVFEFSLIALVILSTVASKIIGSIKTKNWERIRANVVKHLNHLIHTKAPFNSKQFPQAWRRLDILLTVVKELDAVTEDPLWKTIKIELILTIILPLARNAALQNYWVAQFYAAQSFELFADESDQVLIKKLIDSNLPVVRLAALKAALKYGPEIAIDDFIYQMQHQPRLTQSIYIQAFENAPPAARFYIAKFLKSSDSSIRLTAYRILLFFPPGFIDWNIQSDLSSDNLNIKLAALRVLAHSNMHAAIPLLIDQLKDDNWETKVIALNELGRLNAQEAIPIILELLSDDNWWIRLTAAFALKNMGEMGEQALLTSSMALDPKTFLVARHVLRQTPY